MIEPEYTFREISEITGIPYNYVKVLFCRALKKLRNVKELRDMYRDLYEKDIDLGD